MKTNTNAEIGLNIGADVYELGPALYAEWALRRRTAGLSVDSVGGKYALPESVMADKVTSILTGLSIKARVLCGEGGLVVDNDEIFVCVRPWSGGQGKNIWNIQISGETELIGKIKGDLDKYIGQFHSATIHWWYMNATGATSARIALEPPPPFEPSMYPMKGLNGNPLAYMKAYYESDASILFLLGPPGTGKTSLIRQFLWENELSACVAYDEKVLRDDDMFIHFLGYGRSHERPTDIMVLEDVTELLTSREMEKNQMMARFLNVSDGLVQHRSKKIIFTTNLASLKDVDPALLRPGRCHDVMEIGALSYEEAAVACKAAGLPVPTEKRDYLMSELYNHEHRKVVTPRIGILQ